ncbi:M23 family metallopeptidase [Skermania sp. ID1734]|uniref:M23 family metallopeptidase n=1 Tax=Skermania sp. ID1734 TaxID=2597516 RepID=UPI00163D53D1|nr:M23 family metallopeptidase [Skermania sp. ID1734]
MLTATAAGFVVSPGLANAAVTGTVKAKTQRMTAASLKSQQDGWYNVGDKLNLVCSTHGQAVKGYFSFNIPNGGWDSLWYKVSDGRYVADVDIETGTLSAVAPDCPPAQQSPPQAASPAPPSQATLRWPLDSVRINQGFGVGGHPGIDLKADLNTPVFAAADGTVDFEGFGQNSSWMLQEAGICILIKHASIYTGYAHLTRTIINKGQKISKGQLIGYSGNTGYVTGPHLHFEVLPLSPNFHNGFNGRIDPAPYLR